jgi:hypothetical protein
LFGSSDVEVEDILHKEDSEQDDGDDADYFDGISI